MMKRRDPGAKPDRTCCAGKYGTIVAVIAVFICFALISPVAAESADGGTILPVDETGIIPVDTPAEVTADAVMPPLPGESEDDELKSSDGDSVIPMDDPGESSGNEQLPPEDDTVITQEAVVNEALQLQSVATFSVAVPGSSSSINDGSIVISEDGEYIITGTGKKTANTIAVRAGTSATITLSGVIVDTSLYENTCSFSLEDGASVTLILAGDNTLKSGKNVSGLQVPTGAALEISAESSGSLTATGGANAAGIGGGADSGSGEITINGGRITAKGGADGAGIGGGSGGDAYRTFIHDGMVTATGGLGGGAGIGSGANAETSGTISIDGGIVTATGGANGGGAGIGGGYNTNADIIQIDGGVVFAEGAANTKEYHLSGAGIGGGLYRYGNSISITGGMITALGGSGRTSGDYSHAIGNGVQNQNVNLVLGVDEGAVVMTGFSAPGGASDTYASARYARIYFNTLKPKIVEEPEPTGSATPMSIADGDVVITESGNYVVSGTSKTNHVIVSGEDTVATITLDSVNIDATATTVSGEKAPAISVENGATVNLILSGTNILKGGENFAALQVTSDATLIISKASTGSLTAAGGTNAAGIGGGFYAAGSRYHGTSWYDSGIIVINGGQITATGGLDGAGIGGAKYGSGGQITINDGMITATGGAGGAGAGIGSGFQGPIGGLFFVNGGLVTATGGSTGGGAGIGGGAYSDAGTIQIDGGTVSAYGAANTKEYHLSGAGIGGGLYGYGNSISITGGMITALGGSGRTSGDYSHAIGNGVQNQNVNLVLGVDEGAVVMTGSSAPGGTSDTYASARYARIYFNTLKPKIVEEPELAGSTTPMSIADGDVVITESGNYVVSGTSKTNHVIVSGEDTVATITLDGVNIDATATTVSGEKAPAISVENGAMVNLILSGANILKGGENFAALQVTSDATLIISKTSTGSLTATGGTNAAGIGGGFYAADGRYHGTSWYDSGIIVINGGQITATGGLDGAGIGGAKYGSGGQITINDGMITATGGASGAGAGIGSGFQGPVGGSISITDGLVTATGGSTGGGAGIGGGAYSDAGTIQIDGGTVSAYGAANTKEYHLSGAGIGGGLYGYGNSISITGGMITALGGSGRTSGDYSHAIGNGVQNQNVNLVLAIDGTAVVMTGNSVPGYTSDTYASARYARIYFNTLNPAIVSEPAVSGASSTYNVGSGNVMITGTGNYVITGTTNANTITVKGEETVASITLDNVSIDATGTAAGVPAAAFSIEDGAKVKLILKGASSLSGGANYAALQVPEGTTLIVSLESTGSLTATGGSNSAGIGGGFYAAGGHYYDAAWYDAGTIVINGGTVTATGGTDGAGIGGAKFGSGGQITLSAGTITATGGANGGGAGVGSGFQGSVGGIVVINGGQITASGSTDGAGIGGGAYSDAGTILINGGLITSSGAKTEYEYYYSGAGIGGGLYGYGNSITVNGGQITATGGSGRGSNGDSHALGNGFKDTTSRITLLIDNKAEIKAGSKASSATATTYSGQPYASVTLPNLPYTIPTDGTPVVPTQVVTSISLSVPSTVSTGATGVFTAEVKDQNSKTISGETVIWSSSNTTVLEVDPNTGAYTAKADGTTVITATSVSKPSVKKTASVRVNSEPILQVITSVDITGPASAMIGSTGKLAGVVKDQDKNPMPGEKISWSSSNAAILEVVAATGEFHAKAAGSVTITAAAMTKPGVKTTSTLTVSAPSGSYIAVDTSAYAKGIRAGEKVTVPVKVYGADNLAGFTIQVNTAASGVVITPNTTRPSDLPGEIFSASQVNNKVNWASATPASGIKTLFFIDVELQDESISTVPVEISVDKLSDKDRNDVTARYEVLAGMLHVAPPVVEITNTIDDGSWNAVTPAEIVYEVRPTDVAQVVAPEIASGFGDFYLSKGTAVIRFSDKPVESRTVTINPDGSIQTPGSLTNALSIEITFTGEKLGDLDGSGEADIIDALAIVQSVGDMYTPKVHESFYGDVTKDDSLDIFDALAIVQYVGGMTDDNYN